MKANGHEVDRAGIIGVSTKEPHLVGIFGMSQNVQDAAERRLLDHVYPTWARLQSGDVPYLGFGELRPDGLEPIHELDFDRRD